MSPAACRPCAAPCPGVVDQAIDGKPQGQLAAFARVAAHQGAAGSVQYRRQRRASSGTAGPRPCSPAPAAPSPPRWRTVARRPWQTGRPTRGWPPPLPKGVRVVNEGAEKSTVCTRALPGGTRTTAASSGACRLISTSCGPPAAGLPARATAPWFPPSRSRRSAWPWPETACRDSSAVSASAAGRAAVRAGVMGGSSLKRRMKRRSIQSFQCQTQPPAAPSMPGHARARPQRGDRRC